MRLHAAEAGANGEPLVILHGLFGQGRNFGALQSALATSRRVVALDLRNHGESPRGAAMTIPVLAADVAETMAALGIGRAAVLGHSLGGKVAMRLALDQPAHVSRLIVADIAPVRYSPRFADLVAALRALPLTPGLRRADADAALAAAIPDAALRAFLLHSLRVTGDAPSWALGLPEIEAALPDLLDWPETDATWPGPALAIIGGRSPYVGADGKAALLARFPAMRIAIIEGAGHWLLAERPAEFRALVEGFLDER